MRKWNVRQRYKSKKSHEMLGNVISQALQVKFFLLFDSLKSFSRQYFVFFYQEGIFLPPGPPPKLRYCPQPRIRWKAKKANIRATISFGKLWWAKKKKLLRWEKNNGFLFFGPKISKKTILQKTSKKTILILLMGMYEFYNVLQRLQKELQTTPLPDFLFAPATAPTRRQ